MDDTLREPEPPQLVAWGDGGDYTFNLNQIGLGQIGLAAAMSHQDHGVRFNLIDRVLEREPDRLVAVKCVTQAEEYLADHFPGFPVLPGVLMLETLVQAGRLLLEGSASSWDSNSDSSSNRTATGHDQPAETHAPETASPLVLAEARNMRYGNMVRPGQSLTVQVTLRSRDPDGFELAGVGRVEDQVAVQGRFRLVPAEQLC